jgi:hypothetical protein
MLPSTCSGRTTGTCPSSIRPPEVAGSRRVQCPSFGSLSPREPSVGRRDPVRRIDLQQRDTSRRAPCGRCLPFVIRNSRHRVGPQHHPGNTRNLSALGGGPCRKVHHPSFPHQPVPGKRGHPPLPSGTVCVLRQPFRGIGRGQQKTRRRYR